MYDPTSSRYDDAIDFLLGEGMIIKVERDTRLHLGGTKYYSTYILTVPKCGYAVLFNWGRLPEGHARDGIWAGEHGQSDILFFTSLSAARVAVRNKIKAKVKNGYSSSEDVTHDEIDSMSFKQVRKILTPICNNKLIAWINDYKENVDVEDEPDFIVNNKEIKPVVRVDSSTHAEWGSW